MFRIHERLGRWLTDLTNKAESIMDMLVAAQILEDDNWFVTGPVLLYPHYEKNKTRCKIIIHKKREEQKELWEENTKYSI